MCADEVRAQLRPYLKHRSTGRPWVVLKLAATLDGRTAAPDGTSQWITGPLARADAHRLRAESDAILVGAGTVRADDPALTVRDAAGGTPCGWSSAGPPRTPGSSPPSSMSGDLGDVLDDLGRRGVLQVLVEGGATVAADFPPGRPGRPATCCTWRRRCSGGDDGQPLFRVRARSTIGRCLAGPHRRRRAPRPGPARRAGRQG